MLTCREIADMAVGEQKGAGAFFKRQMHFWMCAACRVRMKQARLTAEALARIKVHFEAKMDDGRRAELVEAFKQTTPQN